MLTLASIGLAASAYLTFMHAQWFAGEFHAAPLCDINRFISCTAVAASPASEWFGVPIAWFGAMDYLLIAGLAALALFRPATYGQTAWGLILLLAAVSVAIDAYLAYLMAFAIRAVCLFCLLTYALNLAILILAYRALCSPRGPQVYRALTAALPLSGSTRWGVVLTLCAVAIVTVLGGMQMRQALTKDLEDFDEAGFRQFRAHFKRITVDIDNDPYLGPKDAKLTIIEFSDFQCPFCRRAHRILQGVLPAYRDRVKLVFKNLPLGIACNTRLREAANGRDLHPGACALARLGEAAHKQGKFWPLHDLLFERQEELGHGAIPQGKLLELAREAGLDVERLKRDLADPATAAAVQADLDAAGKLGINATPIFLFNGLLIRGMPPPKVLRRIIAIELGAD